MIPEKEAAEQLARLSILNWFPKKDREAQRQLRLAAEHAHTESVLAAVVTDWLASQTDCPKPADLRRLIYEKQGDADSRKAKCKLCMGSCFVTGWFLVTYKADGWSIKSSDKLQDFDVEQARDLGEKLIAAKANQAVLTAAVACRCMPANHVSRGAEAA